MRRLLCCIASLVGAIAAKKLNAPDMVPGIFLLSAVLLLLSAANGD